MIQEIRLSLRDIATIESSVREVYDMVSSLEGAFNTQEIAFSHLKHVHRMAPSWAASLVEIVRRKEYNDFLVRKAKEFSQIFQIIHSKEDLFRRNFHSQVYAFLPDNIETGLVGPTPLCKVTMTNPPEKLPNLTLDDLKGKFIFKQRV